MGERPAVTREPFFVVGASRSGTTVFRLMLNSHPDIHIPPEAWFLGALATRFSPDRELTSEQVREAREIIRSNVRWSDWNCPDERLDSALAFEGPPSLAGLIDRLFRECTPAGRDRIWGEKSPRHSHIVRQLRAIFPRARFIHLIRDGKDSCVSMFQRGWYDRSFRRVCEHWDTAVRAAREGRDFGAAHYLEIRYEDLMRSTDDVLRSVCAFLGVPFDGRMADFTARIESDIVAGETGLHSSLRGGVQKAMIGKGRDAMTEWQRVVYRTICGPLSKELGYGLPPLGPVGKLLMPFGAFIVGLQRQIHCLWHRMHPRD
ncbi:MAG: sulfotransferase [Terrimicrobiaceae bacterium]|nr:sulfotransferase [Terrimicrobiaceae bacterium]